MSFHIFSYDKHKAIWQMRQEGFSRAKPQKHSELAVPLGFRDDHIGGVAGLDADCIEVQHWLNGLKRTVLLLINIDYDLVGDFGNQP